MLQHFVPITLFLKLFCVIDDLNGSCSKLDGSFIKTMGSNVSAMLDSLMTVPSSFNMEVRNKKSDIQ